MEGLMKVKDVAEYLGICEKSVWNLTHKSKEIPFVRVGRSVRYSRTQLLAWAEAKLAENKTSPDENKTGPEV